MFDTPCTQALWEAVMGVNPSLFKGKDRPVERVSWNDCQEFVTKLKEKCPGLELSLPSEAQWEYACRAGTTTSTYAGQLEVKGATAPILHEIAWYGGNSGLISAEQWCGCDGLVGEAIRVRQGRDTSCRQKRPNPWGLYDTLGNVYEWCEDAWRGDYTKTAGSSAYRVIRGGSWGNDARRYARRTAATSSRRTGTATLAAVSPSSGVVVSQACSQASTR